jgi:Brp/Blh family beta-carotene 15,15'-monooxygenase
VTLRAVHATGFVAAAFATVALFALDPPGMAAQIVGLVVLVALLGVPHGALDMDVARALWPLPDGTAEIAFGATYLSLAAVTVLMWLIAPGPSLMAFLAYSAWHFSDDWRGEWPMPARLAAGGVVVGAPLLFRPAEATAIFAHLAPAEAAALAVAIGGWVGAGALALCLAMGVAALTRPGLRPGAAEVVAIAVASWALPPLIYFVLYFCLLHAPRHFRRTARGLGFSPRRAVRAAAPATAVTLLGAGVAAALLLVLGIAADSTALSVVFITLSALTVPHMILMDRFHGRSGPGAGRLPSGSDGNPTDRRPPSVRTAAARRRGKVGPASVATAHAKR